MDILYFSFSIIDKNIFRFKGPLIIFVVFYTLFHQGNHKLLTSISIVISQNRLLLKNKIISFPFNNMRCKLFCSKYGFLLNYHNVHTYRVNKYVTLSNYHYHIYIYMYIYYDIKSSLLCPMILLFR